MKKVLWLLIMCCSSTAFADVIIFNESYHNNLDVTYRFCDTKPELGTDPICKPAQTVKINPNFDGKGGQVIIPAPTLTGNATYQYFDILSVVEKDETGKEVAKATYVADLATEVDYGYCGGTTVSSKNTQLMSVSRAFYLKDNLDFPTVTCVVGVYNEEKL